MISFFCPYCKMPLTADADRANLLIECVQCKLEVRVPPPTALAPKPATAPQTVAANVRPHAMDAGESWWRRLFSHR
jgi:hypothetical protein